MARKSNKTAHVLNLLSGQDTNEEPEKSEEAKPEAAVETARPDTAAGAAGTEAEAAHAPAKPQATPPEVPSNISFIDNGAKEADPIAERIHEELLKELEQETSSEKASVPEVPVAPAKEEPKVETPEAPAVEEPKAETPEVPAVEEPKTETPEAPAAKEPKAEVPVPEEEPAEESIELSPEPPAEPEPDYVMLNVMQRVVEDKIIYFMKQFEVCTCDRCKADTIALTLSGLPAKYRIVDKHAVDPLVSYYTSRLISQVTVEALKACTQVKENPRH